ncbi:MAG: oligosaccharide flippase family protein [Candidatus Rokubacteria bacterium]|nr:oligosaccharide flippase family protein [Candidatus Rokubacteria bacterium]
MALIGPQAEGPQEIRELVGSGIRAVAPACAPMAIRIGLELCLQLILVRLVAPEAFGIVAFALVPVRFATRLSDLNLQQAAISQSKVTERTVDTAFAMEVGLGIVWTAAMILAAPTLLHRIGKPTLVPFVQTLSILILFERLFFPRALLLRRLEFTRATWAEVQGAAAETGVTLGLAALGFGAWSLVWGLLARVGVQAAALWRAAGFFPHPHLDRSAAQDLLRLGLPLCTSGVLAFLYWNVDDYLVGFTLGEQALGYYSLAFRFGHYLFNFLALFSPLEFALLAGAKSDAQMGQMLVRFLRIAGFVAALPLLLAFSVGPAVLTLLLGEPWKPAVGLIQMFLVVAAIRGVLFRCNHVLVIKRHPHWLLGFSILSVIGIPGLGLALMPGLGPAGMGWAVLTCTLVGYALLTWKTQRLVPARVAEALVLPAVAMVAGALVGAVLSRTVDLGQVPVLTSVVLLLVLAYSGLAVSLWRRWGLPGAPLPVLGRRLQHG